MLVPPQPTITKMGIQHETTVCNFTGNYYPNIQDKIHCRSPRLLSIKSALSFIQHCWRALMHIVGTVGHTAVIGSKKRQADNALFDQHQMIIIWLDCLGTNYRIGLMIQTSPHLHPQLVKKKEMDKARRSVIFLFFGTNTARSLFFLPDISIF